MDPVSMAVVSLGATAASAGMGAIGAANTASANQQSAYYKAAVARNNKIIAERNAEAAIGAGASQGLSNDLKTGQRLGDTLAVQSASGIDVGSGTASDVRQSVADLGRLDTLTIINNAQRSAAGYKAQASNFESDARLYRMTGDNAETAGQYGIASSLIGGASSFSDKWMGYRRSGVL